MLEHGNRIIEMLSFIGIVRKDDVDIRLSKILFRVLMPIIIPAGSVFGSSYLLNHDNSRDITALQKQVDQNKADREVEISQLRQDFHNEIAPVQSMLADLVSRKR